MEGFPRAVTSAFFRARRTQSLLEALDSFKGPEKTLTIRAPDRRFRSCGPLPHLNGNTPTRKRWLPLTTRPSTRAMVFRLLVVVSFLRSHSQLYPEGIGCEWGPTDVFSGWFPGWFRAPSNEARSQASHTTVRGTG